MEAAQRMGMRYARFADADGLSFGSGLGPSRLPASLTEYSALLDSEKKPIALLFLRLMSAVSKAFFAIKYSLDS